MRRWWWSWTGRVEEEEEGGGRRESEKGGREGGKGGWVAEGGKDKTKREWQVRWITRGLRPRATTGESSHKCINRAANSERRRREDLTAPGDRKIS